MSDFSSDLNTLRAGVVEARDAAARRGAGQVAANPDAAMTHLDTALAAHRRLEEIDRVLSRLGDQDGGRSREPEAEIRLAGGAVAKPHARSFGGDVPGDTPRIDTA